MGQICTLTGMILKVAPAGEYDKRIVILTREHGKVTAFARGARRPKSSLQAATDLFCFGQFDAYEGRDCYTVFKADIKNYFRELHTDVERMYYGCYFLELADFFTRQENDESKQLELLYRTVRALFVKSLEPRLVRRIYELKTITLYGTAPNVFSCASCGTRKNLSFFSVKKRGALCVSCRNAADSETIDQASLYTLQYIISSPIGKLYTFKVSDAVYACISSIIDKYLKLYIDREFKTLAFIPE